MAKETPSETVLRTARVGDYVRSLHTHRIYLVTDVIRVHGNPSGHIRFYDVESYEDGSFNAFAPKDVVTLSHAYVHAQLGH